MKKIAFITALAASLFCARMVAAQVAQPVAGYDFTNHLFHPLNIDSSGRLNVIGSASGGSVFGADAPNVAGTQNPVRIGGSSSAVLNSGTVFNWLMSSAGSGSVNITAANGTSIGVTTYGDALASPTSLDVNAFGLVFNGTTSDKVRAANSATASTGTGLLGAGILGFDGTNYQRLSADTSGILKTYSGGVFNTTLPTLTNAQRGDLQLDIHGGIILGTTSTTGADGQGNAYNTIGTPLGSTFLNVRPQLFDGTNWDRQTTIQGAAATGLGTTAVSIAPNTSANAAIVPTVSSALASGVVAKASPGNLYRVTLTTTVSGYLMGFNSITVPADGAVTPQLCRAVPAGSTEVDHAEVPQRYTVGISIAFSTTGCFTKTASVSAMFEVDAQ